MMKSNTAGVILSVARHSGISRFFHEPSGVVWLLSNDARMPSRTINTNLLAPPNKWRKTFTMFFLELLLRVFASLVGPQKAPRVTRARRAFPLDAFLGDKNKFKSDQQKFPMDFSQ